ncbi:MAG TPA: hypothetical protein VFN67_02100 [Polyangiales bacterium]|nr:hypothetical protein [Polyangiales bacterium]
MRERTWNAEARVWLPPHARREPARAEIPRDRPDAAAHRREMRRDVAAESKRAPSTLVAIHVEVRHPVGDAEPTARVIDAHVAEVDDDQDDFEYADPAPIDEETAVFSAHAAESQPFLALPAFTKDVGATQRQERPGSVLQYLSARALSAYLTQHTLVTAAPGDQRLLDLRA